MFRPRLALPAVALAATLLTTVPAITSTASATSQVMPSPSVAMCDALVTTPSGHNCLLPWPNNAFTKSAATPTGLLVNVNPMATPMNKSGVHMNPKYQNQNDGFSPGSVVMIQIPNLSITESQVATSTTIGLSGCTMAGTLTNAEAPIVLYDATTKTCVPYFAELDAQDPDPTLSLIHI